MNQAIQNAVGDAGITNLLIPMCHWHLRNQDQGATLVTIIADLQEVAVFGMLQRSHGKVIQQQDVNARDPEQEAADSAIGMRDGKLTKTVPKSCAPQKVHIRRSRSAFLDVRSTRTPISGNFFVQ